MKTNLAISIYLVLGFICFMAWNSTTWLYLGWGVGAIMALVVNVFGLE